MSSTTSRLGLTKPASGESYSLDVWNTNMQKIDDEAVNRNQDYTWSSAMTVTQFIAACEEKMGSRKGVSFLGYINYSVVEPWGLDFNGYVLGIYHNANYKIILIVASGNNIRAGKLAKVAGTWDETIYQITDNRFMENESFSSTFEGFGRITSSGTKIAFDIPVVKQILAAQTPTLQTGSRFEVRGINGYVGEFGSSNSVEVVGNSAYTVTCVRRNLGAVIHIEITKNSGDFGVTNNTPIQVFCNPLKIKFT